MSTSSTFVRCEQGAGDAHISEMLVSLHGWRSDCRRAGRVASRRSRNPTLDGRLGTACTLFGRGLGPAVDSSHPDVHFELDGRVRYDPGVL